MKALVLFFSALLILISIMFVKGYHENVTRSSEYAIKKWAIEAVTETLTYNYQNYKKRMEKNSSYFTGGGWASFSRALEKSGITDTLIKDKLSLTSSQDGLAEVCNIEKQEKMRIWSVVVPMKSLYVSDFNTQMTSLTTLIFIEETPKGNNEAGPQRAITRWMARGFKTDNACDWYEDVKSVDKDYKELKTLEKGFEPLFDALFERAETGDADGQLAVGIMFLQGVGVETDYKAAYVWLKKAAVQNNIDAYYSLGDVYYEGLGVKQDYHEALKWYKKAAILGQSDAQMQLSILHYTGRGGLPISDIKAYAWADVAANNPKNTDKIKDMKFRDNDIAKNLSSEDLTAAKEKAAEYYKLYVEPFN